MVPVVYSFRVDAKAPTGASVTERGVALFRLARPKVSPAAMYMFRRADKGARVAGLLELKDPRLFAEYFDPETRARATVRLHATPRDEAGDDG